VKQIKSNLFSIKEEVSIKEKSSVNNSLMGLNDHGSNHNLIFSHANLVIKEIENEDEEKSPSRLIDKHPAPISINNY
jgi:hypothetical protein